MEKILSRKFIMAVVSGILIILNDGLGWGLPVETIEQFMYVILGWIFVEGTVDVVRAFKKK